ncbi:MAG: hydrogenase formation protein HypD [Acetobacteraceae bacterium]|nr:hydrogenase formation protein HypD [Acetobacteraceae bacterium]
MELDAGGTPWLSRFKDPGLARRLIARLGRELSRPVRVMEVCGTHTWSISRSGIRGALPEGLELRSGPGCPVCVTDQTDLDRMIALAGRPGLVVASFGDMVRVPGSAMSLEEARALGADVRVVYSPLDAVALAGSTGSQVVFLGVGFETTAPVAALAVEEAARRSLKNFSLFSRHKLLPPALRALISDSRTRVEGFILPGHVSTVLGRRGFDFLASELGVPAVITGFDPVDILLGLKELVGMVCRGEARVVNAYGRVVREDGNPRARAAMDRVFQPADELWRGLGPIPQSGLRLKPEFSPFDAEARFPLPDPAPRPLPRGCSCGEVLKGILAPADCPLFGRACTPERPVGPCMVSSEGACAAYYHYGWVPAREGGEGR